MRKKHGERADLARLARGCGHRVVGARGPLHRGVRGEAAEGALVEALLGEDTTEHVSHVRVRSRVRRDYLDALESCVAAGWCRITNRRRQRWLDPLSRSAMTSAS
jgi:hypothetical protein